MEPAQVEMMFYPPENLQRKTIPLPDFQTYYDRIHAKGSKVNVAFCWLEYKEDNPCLKPLPGGNFMVCDYKTVTRIPDNYHIEYDNHYYSVVYTHCGKSAIVKATVSEIRICDQYNRLICKHKRSYKDFPKYITEDSHMRPKHLYYKEVNEKDGAYYRRWASSARKHTRKGLL